MTERIQTEDTLVSVEEKYGQTEEIKIEGVERIHPQNGELASLYGWGGIEPCRKTEFIRRVLEREGIQGTPIGLLHYPTGRTRIFYQEML